MAKVAAQSKKPASTAKPGNKDEKAKKEKIKRVAYPLPADPKSEDGGTLKLTEIPADWDPKLHKPLTKKDFAEDHLFFELKARQAEAAAAKFRKMGEDSKKVGNVADRAKAKKLQSMQKRMEELKAQLTAQGIDVNALLASSDTAAEAPAEAAAE